MTSIAAKPVALIAAVVIITPVALASLSGMTQINAESLVRLQAAHCQQFDTTVLADFEGRTEPVFAQGESRDARRTALRHVIAISPPALEGRNFERLFTAYGDLKPNSFDLWTIPVKIPLERETHMTWAMRGAVSPPMIVTVRFPDNKSGTLYVDGNQVGTLTNLSDQTLGTEVMRQAAQKAGWKVIISKDIRDWALQTAAEKGWKTEGAYISEVGLNAAYARESTIDIDHVTVWQKRECIDDTFGLQENRNAGRPAPISDDTSCVPNPFAGFIQQDFEQAGTPQLRPAGQRGANRTDLQQTITRSPDTYTGSRAERLAASYSTVTPGGYDLFVVPMGVPLRDEAYVSMAYRADRIAPLVVQIGFGSGRVATYFADGKSRALEERPEFVPNVPDWRTIYSGDIYAWAKDVAKRQGWDIKNAFIIGVGLNAAASTSTNTLIDRVALWVRKPGCTQ